MNLVFIMIDSLRRDFVGVYGSQDGITPAMDSLANRSLVFDNMYPECLPTIPARRSLFTGRRAFPSLDWKPWKGEYVSLRGWQPISEDDRTLAEILGANGYVCGLVADCHHFFKPCQNLTRGFHAYTHIRGQVQDAYKSAPVPPDLSDRYVHPELNEWARRRVLQHLRNNMWRRTEEDYFPARVFTAAANWLEENLAHERLFLWIDCFDPHEPWDPPSKYVEMFDPGYTGREFILVNEGPVGCLSEAELKHCRARYAAETRLVDNWLGWFLDKFEEMGLWENSIVVLMSDHGLFLGEHGLISKVPWALYPELLHVPFMIHVPGVTTPGTRTQLVTQFHDIPVTLLDLLEILPIEGHMFDGRSFANHLRRGLASFRDCIVCGYDENAVVLRNERAYVFTQRPSLRRLFDVRQDPSWENNLLDSNPALAIDFHDALREVVDPTELKKLEKHK